MSIDELGRQLYAALDEQDWSAVRTLVSTDVVIQLGSADPIGFDEWQRRQRAFYVGFPDGRHIIDQALAADDQFVTRCRFVGTHTGEFAGGPPTGVSVSVGVIHVDRFRDGRLVEHYGQLDALGLLQQIGVTA